MGSDPFCAFVCLHFHWCNDKLWWGCWRNANTDVKCEQTLSGNLNCTRSHAMTSLPCVQPYINPVWILFSCYDLSPMRSALHQPRLDLILMLWPLSHAFSPASTPSGSHSHAMTSLPCVQPCINPIRISFSCYDLSPMCSALHQPHLDLVLMLWPLSHAFSPTSTPSGSRSHAMTSLPCVQPCINPIWISFSCYDLSPMRSALHQPRLDLVLMLWPLSHAFSPASTPSGSRSHAMTSLPCVQPYINPIWISFSCYDLSPMRSALYQPCLDLVLMLWPLSHAFSPALTPSGSHSHAMTSLPCVQPCINPVRISFSCYDLSPMRSALHQPRLDLVLMLWPLSHVFSPASTPSGSHSHAMTSLPCVQPCINPIQISFSCYDLSPMRSALHQPHPDLILMLWPLSHAFSPASTPSCSCSLQVFPCPVTCPSGSAVLYLSICDISDKQSSKHKSADTGRARLIQTSKHKSAV